ncbi:hypothetical protein BGW41_000745 [Actinomortierella wolfii]|nr:hypothetical protein BGW41_000745 [Actinomortierella wolfii]
MSTEMDKGLMALMGIEEGSADMPQDNQNSTGSFFDLTSDSDSEMPLHSTPANQTNDSSRLQHGRSPSPVKSLSTPTPKPTTHTTATEDMSEDDDLLPSMESIMQKPRVPSTSRPKRLTLAARMKNKSGNTVPLQMSEPASVDIPTLEYNTLSYQPSLSRLSSLGDSTLDMETQELRDELRELQDEEKGGDSGQRHDSDVTSGADGDNETSEPRAPAPLSKKDQRKLLTAREKEAIELERQRQQLLRNAPLPIEQRVNKKFTLASLLEKAQSRSITDIQPQMSPVDTNDSTNKPAVISLLDTDSEEEKMEQQQKKRAQQQAFLMNPLSKSMQKMRIDPPNLPSTSPNKNTAMSNGATSHHKHRPGQAPSSISIEDFNKTMRRQLAKHNLKLRMKAEEDAKKLGIWKSPEEYATEQLLAEGSLPGKADAGEDGDNEEEDDDYDPENDDGIEAEGDEEMDYGSADEEEIELAKAKKQNEMVDDEAVSDKENSDLAQKAGGTVDEPDAEEDDEEDDSEDESEEDDEDENQIQRRKPSRRRNIIGDDDDVKVVVVHSKEPKKPASVDEVVGLSSDPPDSDQESEVLEASDAEADQDNLLEDNTQSSISGALAFLSGDFGTQATQQKQASPIISSDTTSGFSESLRSESVTSPSASVMASLEELPPPAQPNRNAFDVLQSRMRRLEKREQRQKEILKGKSEYIEYEAEEEDDEFKGYGGIDYESDLDNDDYDMDDGMLDHGVKLKAQDVAAVRQLHMEQEQAQHEKDISELVQGIAAGNLWKRRSGRDGLDLLDTDDEDEDERRRRIKKLKVTEKFEKLADNPQTAAFARAFEKNIGDEELMFLTEPVDSEEEEKTIRKLQRRGTLSASVSDLDSDQEDGRESNDDDELMKEAAAARETAQQDMDEDGDDDEEEALNTDKRRERLAKSRVSLVDKDDDARSNVGDRVDEYKATLRSRKLIDNLLHGIDDEELAQDPDLQGLQYSFSSLDDRIIDRTSHSSEGPSTSGGAFSTKNDEILEFLQVGQRRVARTNSSFMSEERRKIFLSTVSEESRGANASSRMVKEVNRRKVTFRSGVTAKKSEEDNHVNSTSLDVETKSTSTLSKTQYSASASGSVLLKALGGNDI